MSDDASKGDSRDSEEARDEVELHPPRTSRPTKFADAAFRSSQRPISGRSSPSIVGPLRTPFSPNMSPGEPSSSQGATGFRTGVEAVDEIRRHIATSNETGREQRMSFRPEGGVLALCGPVGAGHRHDLVLAVIRRVFAPHCMEPTEKLGIAISEVANLIDLNRPRVLHLAAHADEDGVYLMDRGEDRPVPWDVVVDQFSRQAVPELVVLSCCDSDAVAQSIADRFDVHVVGCAGSVPGEDERFFMTAFYEQWAQRLLGRAALVDAFEDARAAELARHPSARWCHVMRYGP